MQTRIVAFVKDPLNEPVKTRLAQKLGKKYSAEFYEICLRLLDVQLQELSRFGFETMIAVSAQRPSEMIMEIFSKAERCQQGVGPIGQRINTVDIFVRKKYGASKLVFIGSDAPTLPNEIIISAIAALDDFDAAIAPADDGGFVALASRRMLPTFGGAVKWSHQDTFKDTESFLRDAKFTLSTVNGWYDVDEFQDMIPVRSSLLMKKSLSELENRLLELTIQCLAKG